MPEISVIVPVYKTEAYLHRCVDSILSQTFTDFELILVDDGSPDNCGTICDEYAKQDQRIRVFHQNNRGQAAARNLALDWIFENSDSKYVSFADSDDWVHPKYLELLRMALQKQNSSMSQCRYIRTQKKEEFKYIETAKIICVSPDEQYSNWFSAYFWGKMFNKSCFLNVRFPEGRIFEDVLIWYRMLFQLDSVAIVDADLYFYFQRSDNTTNGTWTPAKLAQIEAWDNQLAFALKRNNKSVLQTAFSRFCWVYKHQYEEITISNLISDEERKKYQKILLNKMRFTVIRFGKLMKEMGIFSDYFEWAFPKTNWLYWTAKGIAGKFKRTRHE